MVRSSRAWLSGVLVLCAASILLAQATADRYATPAAPSAETAGWTEEQPPAGPPAWNDGASVYLSDRGSANEQQFAEDVRAPYDDPRVAPAAYQQEDQAAASTPAEPRRLAPPSRALRSDSQEPTTATGTMSSWGLPIDSLVTTITALVLVIGLFLLCVWALRRGSRQTTGMLPADVVSVLGSTPLGGRRLAQLLRVGNKLVLVSVTPSGTEPLVEVTDPIEVERLLGLCLQGGARGPARMAGLYGSTNATPDFAANRRLDPAPTLRDFSSIDVPPAKSPALSDLFRSYQGGGERV